MFDVIAMASDAEKSAVAPAATDATIEIASDASKTLTASAVILLTIEQSAEAVIATYGSAVPFVVLAPEASTSATRCPDADIDDVDTAEAEAVVMAFAVASMSDVIGMLHVGSCVFAAAAPDDVVIAERNVTWKMRTASAVAFD
jgi:hypothetical protein